MSERNSSAQELLALEKSFFFKYSTLRRILTGSEAPAGDNGAMDKDIDRKIAGLFIDQSELNKGLFVEYCLSLLCDEARFKNNPAFENDKEPDMLNLQDGIVLLGCNWDVIHVIYDYIEKPDDSTSKDCDTVKKSINKVLTDLDEKLKGKESSIKNLNTKDQLTKLYYLFEASLEHASELAGELLSYLNNTKNKNSVDLSFNEESNSIDWNKHYWGIRKFLELFGEDEVLIEKKSTGNKLTAKIAIDSLDLCNTLLTQGVDSVGFDGLLNLNNNQKNKVKKSLTLLCESIVNYKEARDSQKNAAAEQSETQSQKPAENGKKSDLCEQVIKGIASLVQCCERIAEAKESQQTAVAPSKRQKPRSSGSANGGAATSKGHKTKKNQGTATQSTPEAPQVQNAIKNTNGDS